MVQNCVRKALTEAPFSQRQLAEDIGIGYDTLYSWAHGLRKPRPKNLLRLAAWLDEHGDLLKSCAEEIRNAAEH